MSNRIRSKAAADNNSKEATAPQGGMVYSNSKEATGVDTQDNSNREVMALRVLDTGDSSSTRLKVDMVHQLLQSKDKRMALLEVRFYLPSYRTIEQVT